MSILHQKFKNTSPKTKEASVINEDNYTFPKKAKCERCGKIVPFDETWNFSTFSADEGMLEFRLCTECKTEKERGNHNIQRFVWEFRERRKILRDSGFDED